MLIPLSCDAPQYHRPWGTVGVIALCFVLHVTVGSSDARDAWILNYGSWNPIEWLSSALVHDGWLHLIGNMVFFWVFGLIIEGKLGWWRFLGVLVAIAALSGAIEQTIMLGSAGGSLGLSGVIFGLIAIAWMWAPENEVDVLLLLFPFIRHFDVRVQTLGLIYVGLEIISAIFNSFQMSTPVLHLIGALAGAPIGIIMLKQGWVDCEGWDWFSRRNRHRRPSATTEQSAIKRDLPADPVAEVRTLLNNGQLAAAHTAWSRQRARIPATLAYQLAAHLADKRQWDEAEEIARCLSDAHEATTAVRLLHAWVLTQKGRPAAALEMLAEMRPSDPVESAKLDRIRQEALRKQADIPYEMA